MPGADNGREIGIGTELTRRAGRAVLRILEVTEEVVVFERRDDEERCVERYTCQAQERPIMMSLGDHSSSILLPFRLAADEHLEPRGHAAQVRLADLLR